jgi:hypothetical protein
MVSSVSRALTPIVVGFFLAATISGCGHSAAGDSGAKSGASATATTSGSATDIRAGLLAVSDLESGFQTYQPTVVDTKLSDELCGLLLGGPSHLPTAKDGMVLDAAVAFQQNVVLTIHQSLQYFPNPNHLKQAFNLYSTAVDHCTKFTETSQGGTMEYAPHTMAKFTGGDESVMIQVHGKGASSGLYTLTCATYLAVTRIGSYLNIITYGTPSDIDDNKVNGIVQTALAKVAKVR